ncbi:KAP family NTPase [Thermoanaerobacter thermocopriae]|uniref:KAP family NTPase n=2 Tax=Thermoanaerobacter thermocopriae TaxID=29350 RepID=UPI0004B53B2C|nr:P-loop NTPase fold protein [Thermoanaerobacter thermocopriae]
MEENTVFTDKPLQFPEHDRLGFAPAAERIAEIIKTMQVEESVVFAVCGRWGSGKTTFLNFISHYLKDDSSISIVRFDPWWFSGKENLMWQFFKNLSLSLKKSAKFEKIANKLEIYAEILEELPKVGPLAKAVRRATRLSQKSVEETKEQIARRLEKIKGKIVIMIDDIDRLTAEEIRELFAVVKAVADFPNTVYILAFDKEVVEKALEKVQEGDGSKYLEKIVQAHIELPWVSRTSIKKILLEELDKVLQGTPEELFDRTYWGNVYLDGIDPFITTIRDVKRLINALKLTYPSVKGEVNAVDFIAVEALRIFCPKVYHIIRSNPDMFCGSTYSSVQNSADSLKQFHENWLTSLEIPENFKKNVQKLLIRLFPKLEKVFSSVSYGPDWEKEWRRKCRICSKEIFPRFFSFSVPSDDISEYEMKNILVRLHDKDFFSNYLKSLSEQIRSDGSTKVSVFLDKMEDYISEIPEDNIPAVIETFFNIGDELIIPEDKGRYFLFSWWGNDIRMSRIIDRLLERYPEKNKRFEVLKNAFEKGYAVSMMVSKLGEWEREYGKQQDLEEPDRNILLDKNQLVTLKGIALDKVKEAAREGKLLNTPFLPAALYFWKELRRESEVKDWVKEIISSDEKLITFLSKFSHEVRIIKGGDRVERTYWKLSINLLKDFVDLDLLEERCVKILSNSTIKLKDEEKLLLEQFIKMKHLLDEGENPDDPLFDKGLE